MEDAGSAWHIFRWKRMNKAYYIARVVWTQRLYGWWVFFFGNFGHQLGYLQGRCFVRSPNPQPSGPLLYCLVVEPPSRKICSSKWESFPSRGWNFGKKVSKPPLSIPSTICFDWLFKKLNDVIPNGQLPFNGSIILNVRLTKSYWNKQSFSKVSINTDVPPRILLVSHLTGA